MSIDVDAVRGRRLRRPIERTRSLWFLRRGLRPCSSVRQRPLHDRLSRGQERLRGGLRHSRLGRQELRRLRQRLFTQSHLRRLNLRMPAGLRPLFGTVRANDERPQKLRRMRGSVCERASLLRGSVRLGVPRSARRVQWRVRQPRHRSGELQRMWRRVRWRSNLRRRSLLLPSRNDQLRRSVCRAPDEPERLRRLRCFLCAGMAVLRWQLRHGMRPAGERVWR